VGRSRHRLPNPVTNNNALIDGDITVITNGVSSFSVTGEQSGATVAGSLD
jgi:hypothetical protein